jgi:hypothetical protein
MILDRMGIKLFLDGDSWCCLKGANVQEGIAGFGDTANEAIRSFIRRFRGEKS